MFPYRTRVQIMSKRNFRVAIQTVTLACCVLVPAYARAESAYPGNIQAELQLSYTPACTLCHATTSGGGPVVTKFAQTMVSYGLTGNTSSFKTAISQLEKNNPDSDGDGISDIEALKQAIDPSTGQEQPNAKVPEEKYGCGARIAPGATRAPVASALVALVAGVALMRRRRGRN